jgi:osmotically-inducible protein OsmY
MFFLKSYKTFIPKRIQFYIIEPLAIKEDMKTDLELQTDIQNAIKREPLLNVAEIGVIVKDGIVSLTGTVDSYAKKIEAELATKKVIGVKALVENIEVKFPDAWNKTNAEIATEVLNALKSNSSIPQEKITVRVEGGWVSLEGELCWNYQREAAKNAVNYLTGVKGVTNNIAIKSETKDIIEQAEVKNALDRILGCNDLDIHVNVSGTKVVLTGTVSTIYIKEEASRIAWSTPGIEDVENNIEVDYYYELG